MIIFKCFILLIPSYFESKENESIFLNFNSHSPSMFIGSLSSFCNFLSNPVVVVSPTEIKNLPFSVFIQKKIKRYYLPLFLNLINKSIAVPIIPIISPTEPNIIFSNKLDGSSIV